MPPGLGRWWSHFSRSELSPAAVPDVCRSPATTSRVQVDRTNLAHPAVISARSSPQPGRRDTRPPRSFKNDSPRFSVLRISMAGSGAPICLVEQEEMRYSRCRQGRMPTGWAAIIPLIIEVWGEYRNGCHQSWQPLWAAVPAPGAPKEQPPTKLAVAVPRSSRRGCLSRQESARGGVSPGREGGSPLGHIWNKRFVFNGL